MAKASAGILLYRVEKGLPEFFLVHPGGPFWKHKDAGAWSIPKGEFEPGDDPLAAAQREFEEETGQRISGDFTALAPVKQKGGKTIYAWAVEGNIDPAQLQSNIFEMEWPPRSGRKLSFPEVDRGEWFSLEQAKEKILEGQVPLLEELAGKIK